MKKRTVGALLASALMAIMTVSGCSGQSSDRTPTGTLASTTTTKATTKVTTEETEETTVEVEETEIETEATIEEEEESAELTEKQTELITLLMEDLDENPNSKENKMAELKEKGWTDDDIEFAFDYLQVDWGYVASIKMFGLMADTENLSAQAVVNELSKLGFTDEEIETAINDDMVDWNEQAFFAAASLIEDDMSMEDLKTKMVEEYLFTEDEADYAIKTLEDSDFSFEYDGDIEIGDVFSPEEEE